MAHYLHETEYHDMIIFAKAVTYFIGKKDICCVTLSITLQNIRKYWKVPICVKFKEIHFKDVVKYLYFYST